VPYTFVSSPLPINSLHVQVCCALASHFSTHFSQDQRSNLHMFESKCAVPWPATFQCISLWIKDGIFVWSSLSVLCLGQPLFSTFLSGPKIKSSHIQVQVCCALASHFSTHFSLDQRLNLHVVESECAVPWPGSMPPSPPFTLPGLVHQPIMVIPRVGFQLLQAPQVPTDLLMHIPGSQVVMNLQVIKKQVGTIVSGNRAGS
jgi:hypothetical protein